MPTLRSPSCDFLSNAAPAVGAVRSGWAHSQPITRAFNHLIAGTHFARRFQRWPLPVGDPRALINDHIFARMIDPDWTDLERAVVDKATAKFEAAKLAPMLRAPHTLGIIAMDDIASVEALYQALKSFIGMPAIAKPTHASGAVIFLRDLKSARQLDSLFSLASMDYSSILREMQYAGMRKQIIVEMLVDAASEQSPDDYKFHCANGVPIVCQVDHSRFGRPWSRLLRIPDLEPFDPADGLTWPETYRRPTAERIAAMIEAASALSKPFQIVRVDLYDGRDGIFFGELTFSPAAALGIAPSAMGDHAINPTHLAYSTAMVSALSLSST
ncbi:ATP-grasp fold amidoligase family protein [Sphingomonas sp. M1-B02]|uniref:ATP-grasp fold amidoligase family protein n=1 Tax=Sphingomonas sp. M1-B02 TaxID=3114300 RepID=UPI00223FFC4F|nr:ATP-grasp fold amidoligase family protein [Sphingomonas sp. S6-11]UZK67824.1 ATP-grasp fold amidoligase family protein [Sphingomonas sp. S6-11]